MRKKKGITKDSTKKNYFKDCLRKKTEMLNQKDIRRNCKSMKIQKNNYDQKKQNANQSRRPGALKQKKFRTGKKSMKRSHL